MFYIVTTHIDQMTHGEHVLDLFLCVIGTIWQLLGCGLPSTSKQLYCTVDNPVAVAIILCHHSYLIIVGGHHFEKRWFRRFLF